MRGKTDFRQDDIVKREVLDKIVERYGEANGLKIESVLSVCGETRASLL